MDTKGSSALKPNERYSYADLLSRPESERWELTDGVPFDMSPSPRRAHQKIVGKLFAQLDRWFEIKPCEPYVAPIDVFLPDEGWVRDRDDLGRIDKVVQPDLIVVCDRDKLIDEGILGAPDLIVEILSPATAYRDVTEKRILYEKHRVREYWIVNPDTLEVQIYLLVGSAYGLPRSADLEESVPVTVFEGLA